MSFFNVVDQTDKLNQVLLGNWVVPEYFDSIKEKSIREPLKKLSEEILEDLEIFSNTLKEHGVSVYQTNVLEGKYDFEKKVIPSLSVRNCHHVIGNKLFQLQKNSYHNEILELFFEHKNNIIDISNDINKEHLRSCKEAKKYYSTKENMYARKEKYYEIAGSSWPNFKDFIDNNYKKVEKEIIDEINSFKYSFFYDEGLTALEGPNIIIVNNKIIIDSHEYSNYIDVLKKYVDINDMEWVSINTTAGHTDGCFVYLNKSNVVTIENIINHQTLFNGINEINIPWANYQQSLTDFKKIKQKNNGKWWLPGEEDNNKVTHFINQYLDHWVGYTEETVFDVNVLPLDSNNVFVSSNQKQLHDLFKKNKIDPIYVPWRHRFFTDNGLHCITLCLHRG